MPVSRRRAEAEFEQTQSKMGTETLTLSGLTGGRNSYTNPELLSPQFWTSATVNVYSGLHGAVRRARWAPIYNAAALNLNNTSYANGTIIQGMFSFFPNGAAFPYLIIDNSNTSTQAYPFAIVEFGRNNAVPFTLQLYFPTAAFKLGPYMRFASTAALILQTNGLIRTKFFYISSGSGFDLQYWGLDTPDASPNITLAAGSTATLLAAPNGASRTSNIVTFTATAALPANFVVGAYVTISGVTDTSFNSAAGTTFQIQSVASPSFTVNQIGPNATSGSGTATVQITKTTGRSYQFAWENTNTGHVSAPSPASQYIAYSNQTGTVDCIQPGSVAISSGNPVIVGTNTFFTSAWVGRNIWINQGAGGTIQAPIISVADTTHLTVSLAPAFNNAGLAFQIYDPQATHIRLYATGDGGTTYLRIARNAWVPSHNLATSGLEFIDTANSEPPNAPFTNEIVQNQNVPPPIGKFLQDYQGRVLVYGVTGALQAFFYSNIESTVVGQPPESFAPLNEVILPVGEAQLNGMANLPTGLVIWSNHQDMFKLTGTLTDNTVANAQQLGAAIQRLPYKIGCASPYATAVTSLGAFWFSSDREVWLFTDHYAPKNIGKPIQDLLNLATRIGFARMKNYKAGDRNWLALAITTKGGSFNDTLCLLDLDLLSSNGQPSFFTFDMATNQPSWYIYNTNCESIETAIDANSTNHLLTGDIDLITDVDWTDGYYTVSAEQSIPAPQLTLHALGNQDPEVIKTGRWMRVTTNQLPKNLASQGWNWNILCYDDDKYVLGINPQIVKLVPGVDSPSQVFALEYSPSVFRFGGIKPVKGRRFQIQANFPSGPGFYELRGFQVSYDQIVSR